MDIEGRLEEEVGRYRYPLVFATISGAHLYGFASSDSDYDLRGFHVLALREVVGLERGEETIDRRANGGGYAQESAEIIELASRSTGPSTIMNPLGELSERIHDSK
jgi:hypothetical protein